MSGAGYIYVKNWRKRQHHKYESPPWHKVYNSTLRDDAYLALTHTDRGLLQDLWSLASLSGDGRVSADRTFLARHLNVRRVSLEPLIQAGFIEVWGTRSVRGESRSVTTEKETEKSREEPLDVSRNRSSRAEGTVSEDQPKNGHKPTLPSALAKILDEKISASLTDDQTAIVGRAWFCSTELRHSLASVEAADNPAAMLVSISQRIIKGAT